MFWGSPSHKSNGVAEGGIRVSWRTELLLTEMEKLETEVD